MPKSKMSGKLVIIVGIIIAFVCLIFFVIGHREMSEASESLRAQMGWAQYGTHRALFYLPGERMRDYSVVGIIIGICITIWGAVITHQAKKERDGDGKMPDLLATVIDEQNKKREGIK